MSFVSRGGKLLWFRPVLALAAAWIALAQQAQQPRKVDDAALKNAAQTGEEWITYNLGWSEQRFSRLDQINASNVNRLGLAWYSDIPAAPGNPQNRQEATPLVYNGVVYSIRACGPAPWWRVCAGSLNSGTAFEIRGHCTVRFHRDLQSRWHPRRNLFGDSLHRGR